MHRRANTFRLAKELTSCYVPCRFCRGLKPTQDMELHLDVCRVRRQDDKGYTKPAEMQRLLNPRAYRLAARMRVQSTPNLRSSASRGGTDSETLVDEDVSPATLSSQWTPIAPDLADRFPIIEPLSPELPAVNEREKMLPSPLDLSLDEREPYERTYRRPRLG